MYDYLVVGAGLFGSVFAYEKSRCGAKCLVIDKRCHIGGNSYTKEIEGINVHIYGPHIFHTSNKKVWDYINQFAEFNRFTNAPLANYKGQIYNLPFNMNTFNKLWGVVTPREAIQKIDEQIKRAGVFAPSNLEEQSISLAGADIYEMFIKGYTEKQWGRECRDLPAFIIRRLPVRFTYDNNYYNDKYQGIPAGGYTKIFEKMLNNINVELCADFMENKSKYMDIAHKIIYTGSIDKFFNYKYGSLAYRSLRFETMVLDNGNYQGNAVVNYTERDIPYTRIIEHKHFEFGNQPKTVISKEYPVAWNKGDEPFYPINDEKNNKLLTKYQKMAEQEKNILFAGRLGDYKYYDMDEVVAKALEASASF